MPFKRIAPSCRRCSDQIDDAPPFYGQNLSINRSYSKLQLTSCGFCRRFTILNSLRLAIEKTHPVDIGCIEPVARGVQVRDYQDWPI